MSPDSPLHLIKLVLHNQLCNSHPSGSNVYVERQTVAQADLAEFK